MFKKKHFSVYDDFKTGFLYKLSFFIGLILLIAYIFLKIVSFFSNESGAGLIGTLYELSQSGFADSAIAFSIVFIGLGFILYFFHRQFAKLAKIADEIERGEETKKNKKEAKQN